MEERDGWSGGDEGGLRRWEDGNKDLRARDYLLWSKDSRIESVAVQSVNVRQRGLEIRWWRGRNEGENEWSMSWSNCGSN